MVVSNEVGFIGLGSMGAAMARRLLAAGVRLHVFDAHRPAMANFTAAGAVEHASPKSVADAVGVVFACLPGLDACKAVALGADGVCHGERIATYVECSTVGRRLLLEIEAGLARQDVAVVDAPVSGGPKVADQGKLTVMCSGEPAALDMVRPLLQMLGSKVFEVGAAPGMAQMMKLVNNIVSSANMVAAFEAAVLGAKAGLDVKTMVDVLNAGTGRNTATETKLPMAVLPGTFDFGARIDIMYKDVTLALAEAEALGVPMRAAQGMAQLWRYAITQGGGPDDYTTLIKYMEAWAGVEVRAK
ncbi:NAD(P)-dependent oxidoreductase [Paraburkholderia sp. J41]|uniref:NAD(P)-dependent oxidoreductase n=1 Tax=Paraburkholderia sp. J41 TaxID=2805433 RepID=UPI002AC34FD0|nr:NAD(P)-dependent oxidoreductase [Paraburkholderia sp. J41]